MSEDLVVLICLWGGPDTAPLAFWVAAGWPLWYDNCRDTGEIPGRHLKNGVALGSTTVAADANREFVDELRYKAWREDRYTSGTTPTTYRYTGQRQEEGIGL